MEIKNSIAFSRDRRNNAGSRMMKLIEAEDEDDFYKTTYGGFTEEADDNDYISEDSNSDATDSDIDVNEDDELKSDVEEEKEEKKKSNKAYKEPKKNVVSSTEKPVRIIQNKDANYHLDHISASEKKSLRKSTFEKSIKMEDVVKERVAKSAILKQIADKKRVAEVRRLTQEELLEEARITEGINLASLEYYQQMELERKRVRIQHQVNSGPTIRFTSMSISKYSQPQDDIDQKDDVKSQAKYSQNFISFSDEQTFKENFPHWRPPQPAIKHICSITHLPAKYFDPVTKQPYANIEAFKILRQEHKRQMEIDNLDLESRKKNKSSYYF